jgi:GNAT superfamily N-acetyltransferase
LATLATILLDPLTVDERTASAWHELYSLLSREVVPDDEPIGLEQLLVEARNPLPEESITRLLVVDERRGPLAVAEVEVHDTEDNRHLAFVRGGVHPEARRQGIGTRLLHRCAELARAADRTKLDLWAIEGSAGDRFLEACGATFVFLARMSRCPVAALDLQQLRRWAEPLPGYSFLTWAAPTPEEHLESLARVLHVMNTAPMQDADVEDEVFSADLLRGRERAIAERRVTKLVTVARHDGTGELVGVSVLYFDAFRHERATQGNIGVDPNHRGSGLGRALTAANILRLLHDRPETRFIDSDNQDENGPMLAINRAMGFRPHFRCRVYQLPVAHLLGG